MPSGERMGIAYAFRATFTPTRKRPVDEHSFQVKYGSREGRFHSIWTDPYGLYTTLVCGINPEQAQNCASCPPTPPEGSSSPRVRRSAGLREPFGEAGRT